MDKDKGTSYALKTAVAGVGHVFMLIAWFAWQVFVLALDVAVFLLLAAVVGTAAWIFGFITYDLASYLYPW